MHTRLVVAFLATSFAVSAAPAQTAPPRPAPLAASIASHPSWPSGKNYVRDVDSIDHLIAALYDVISGPPTRQRDWERFRSLFLPDGRLGIVRPDKPGKPGDVYFLTPDMYVERDDPYFHKEGFFERGIANRIETFGNLTAVWSTYESRHALDEKTPFARGVNSLQITHAQGRYWIASIVWDDEREGLVLPEKYLKQ